MAPLELEERPLLRFTTAGSVDDGKSTLIGRLLHDAHSVYDDHMEALRTSRVNRAAGALDFSLLTDGLKAEREQGITIDVAYRHFATARRRFLIADTPGHEQYTRNMATGASTADAAVILVDARHGLTAQSRRHAYIAWLLGIRHLLIAVNKMDLAGYGRPAFERVRKAWDQAAAKLPGCRCHLVPVSALEGENVAARSMRMPWYHGPSLMELLETIDVPAPGAGGPFRFGVQYVIRPDLNFRGYAGRIEGGVIRAGERVTVLPSGKRTRVKRIVTFDGDLEEAFAPMAVTLVLEDELDVSRGDWICGEPQQPQVAQQIEAAVVWMHEQPLQPGAALLVQHGTARVLARVREIVHRIDPETYTIEPAAGLALNEIGLVRLEAARALVFDPYQQSRQTGSFVLIDPVANHTLGAGMIERAVKPKPVFSAEPVSAAERRERYGHRAALVVSRTETRRRALERALFARGAAVVVLQAMPPAAVLRDLLANGLIVIVPPQSGEGADGTPDAVPGEEPVESVMRRLYDCD